MKTVKAVKTKWILLAGVFGCGVMLACARPVLAQDASAGAPATGTPQAQQPTAGKGKRAGKMHERAENRMLAQLNLTDAQKQQIKTIETDARTKATVIHNDATLAPADKKAKMQELSKDTREKIATVLTPDQKAKLKELRKEQRAKRKQQANTPPAAPAPGAGTSTAPGTGA